MNDIKTRLYKACYFYFSKKGINANNILIIENIKL